MSDNKYTNPRSQYYLGSTNLLLNKLFSLPVNNRLEFLEKSLGIKFIAKLIEEEYKEQGYEKGMQLAYIVNMLSLDELDKFYSSEFGNKLLDRIISDGNGLVGFLKYVKSTLVSEVEDEGEEGAKPKQQKPFWATKDGIKLAQDKIVDDEELIKVLVSLPLPTPDLLSTYKVNFLSNLGIDFLDRIIIYPPQFIAVLDEGLACHTNLSVDHQQRAQFLLSEVGKALVARMVGRLKDKIFVGDINALEKKTFKRYVLKICPEFDWHNPCCWLRPNPVHLLSNYAYYEEIAENLKKDPSSQTLTAEKTEASQNNKDKKDNELAGPKDCLYPYDPSAYDEHTVKLTNDKRAESVADDGEHTVDLSINPTC